MSSVATSSVVRQIGSLFDGGSVAGVTDGELLERFNRQRDAIGDAAFAALVTRHGPMVLRVCRQLLGDRHHAEDAFQATFLVLARKAWSIRDPDLLGNWLYGVALRAARKARGQIARRRRKEEGDAMTRPGSVASVAPEPMAQPVEDPLLAREQAEVLYSEIDRLPRPFRLPVVLCYLEGLTHEEAARRLRCPAGTVRSRLARACDKLRRGLTRRGVAISGAPLAAALSSRSALASVSSSLCDMTTRAAIHFAAGQAAGGAVSALAMALAQEVLRSMFMNKLRLIAMTVLLLGAVATGAGYHTHSLASQDEPKRQPDAPPPHRRDDTTQPPAPGRMFVVGRVLDPQGKPVPNATTMVYAAIKQPGSGGGGPVEKMKPSAIGQARSDDSGRFQIDAPRTSSSRHQKMGAVATAPGYGAGWVEQLDPDADRPIVDVSLWPEQVIQGRLFDLIGRPVQGVEVRVQSMGRVILGDLARRHPYGMEGPRFGWDPGNGLPAWPKPAISDSEGRFTVRGVGRALRVVLMIDDPRFARQVIPVDTDGPSESKPVTLALVPAKIIKGRITDADTGKPIPHAQLSVLSYNTAHGGIGNEFEADAQGRFRANPMSAKADRYQVSVTASEGQPYLGVSKVFNWPKGAVEYPLDLALPRGVVIRGKVTEDGSGKLVAGASIGFRTPRTAAGRAGALNGRAASGSDGSFQIAVQPSPGYLIVLGPSDDYVLREIDENMVSRGEPGGRRYYAHAIIACNVKPNSESLDVNIMLRPGMSVTGRVVGPDEQPIQDAWMISRVCPLPSTSAWLLWRASHHGSVKSGRFEVHGLDPDVEVPVYFLDPHHKLGAAADFSGKSAAGGSVLVRLQPCGTAKARLIDASGKPIAGYRGSYLISMNVAPPYLFRHQEATLAMIDTINYADGAVSDALGRIVLPALIPRAPYRLSNFKTGTQRYKDFTVKPGEILDLGDFVIEKPQS